MPSKWIWLVIVVPIAGVAAAFALGAGLDSRPHAGAFPAADSVGRFLVRYWAAPLPPEGPPPKGYSALEASLAPQSCGQCHRQQYDDWRTSLHSHSVGPGLLWQFRIMNQAQANKCMRCHAPLAEQKALAALGLHWRNAPLSPPPAYIGRHLFRQGLVCAGCHVRRHRRFGPPPRPGMPPGDTPGLPHGGFSANAAFQDSRFCATCHQFPPTGPSLNGKLFENTYREWRASRFAREGKSCQSCHMPNGRHLWRGIHSPAMVRQGLKITLTVTRNSKTMASARAVVRSTGVGHDFPTYLTPKVYVTLYALDPNGTHARVLTRRVIGRTVNVALTQELADTRIPPGGSAVVSARFALAPRRANKVELRIDVAPGEHYERMYRHYQRNEAGRYDRTTVALLRKAIAETTAKRYRLTRLVVPIPGTTGDSRRSVAN